jgi:excisionase family DNA binding protein
VEVHQPQVLAVSYRKAAAMSGVDQKTIQRAVAAKRLPAVRLGRRCVRILLVDLERWLASQRQPQAPATAEGKA